MVKEEIMENDNQKITADLKEGLMHMLFIDKEMSPIYPIDNMEIVGDVNGEESDKVMFFQSNKTDGIPAIYMESAIKDSQMHKINPIIPTTGTIPARIFIDTQYKAAVIQMVKSTMLTEITPCLYYTAHAMDVAMESSFNLEYPARTLVGIVDGILNMTAHFLDEFLEECVLNHLTVEQMSILGCTAFYKKYISYVYSVLHGEIHTFIYYRKGEEELNREEPLNLLAREAVDMLDNAMKMLNDMIYPTFCAVGYRIEAMSIEIDVREEKERKFKR